MTEKDKYQRAAELLLKGATMLNLPCPECNDPIYQMRDKSLYCSTCEKKVVHESELKEVIEQQPVIEKKTSGENPIQNKIAKLGEQLDHETDPQKIMELAELIANLQKLL